MALFLTKIMLLKGLVLIRDEITVSGLALVYTLLKDLKAPKCLFLSTRTKAHYVAIGKKMGFSFPHFLVEITSKTTETVLNEVQSLTVSSRFDLVVIDDISSFHPDTTLAQYAILIEKLTQISETLVAIAHQDVLGNALSPSLLPWLLRQTRLDLHVCPLDAGWTAGVDGMVELTDYSKIQPAKTSFLFQVREHAITFRSPGMHT
jgi:hypothetical protein